MRIGRWKYWGPGLMVLVLILCIKGIGCSHFNLRPPSGNPPPQPALQLQPVEMIPPGTVIGESPPPGWTHLILKTHPHPGAGDLGRLNETTTELASFLFTAFLAEVKPQVVDGVRHYRLGRVAVGVGTRINGRETIISPDTQNELGADLGILARTVLSKWYEGALKDHLVARSATMGLVDTPVTMLREGKHRPVVLRYALLVDEHTGRLDTLLWLIDCDDQGGYHGPSSPIEWLPPNKVEDCILHVDGNEFNLLGVPSDIAFAMYRLPRGRKEIDFPSPLSAVAGRVHLSPDQARMLEAGLRALLAAN
jgi:hypothetical protein